ncbi:sugar O-acetyltransferase [Pseudoruegeria sp. SHC-113]|uniref:sugar O-acetyltransferase n=1 Tax=Pseudoruegeria sp. SHC-113 TaxID=2855439 RepID=UPI0028E0A064|nr:sugar O-acetyltransferase [Pseudoruegeria sp. SHC-113]MCT8159976.1 sugar O-acetyltransferase [Pseudoruegeria sp. SHC-113]
MEELEKAAAGLLYDANYDPDALAKRHAARVLVHEINHIHPDLEADRKALFRKLLARTGESFFFEGPVHIDYGFNLSIGENFYANANFTVLDGAKVTIGDNCFIAPNVGLYTAGHPLDAARRNAGLEYAHPITIGDNVWIGAGVSILPGTTIGDGTVIAAGSVVRGAFPGGVILAGAPARVIREITEADSSAYT